MSHKTPNEIFNETKSKLQGYVTLYYFHLGNLCIKADPIALLSTTVEVNGDEMNLEEVAEISLEDDYTFAITPKGAKQVFPVCKAIQTEHPEFKMEEKTERNELTDEEEVTIHFTMPTVNENRRDVCMDYIKAKYELVTAKMDVAFTTGTAKMTASMIGLPAETVDKAKEKLQALYDQHMEMCNKLRDDKTKEVEDAYLQYYAEHAEQTRQDEEMQAAHSSQNVFSMNMKDEKE
jgi:ribosome recycling factor